MKKMRTISLEDVKGLLRAGKGGSVRNESGWCVYLDAAGKRYYVVDEEDSRPVPFRRISFVRSSYAYASGATVSPLN